MGQQLHRWNEGFVWADVTEKPSTLQPRQVSDFDENGFFVLDDVFDEGQLAALVAELDELEAETEAFLRTMDDERLMIAEADAITFTVHAVARSAMARAAAHNPTLVGACRDLLGPDVRLYWDQAVYKKPTKPRRFPWHQDNGYTFVEPQQYLTCWVALSDATVANGCPWVVPGQHRNGTLRHSYVHPLGFECSIEADEAISVEVEAGSAVVFSSLTPHLTGPNRTDLVRKSYILQYAADGAETLQGDADLGPSTGRVRCDDPQRQFHVLRDGQPSSPGLV